MPVSRVSPLLASILASPGRALAAVLALHAVVWTALPALLYPNLPLDLIEALIYGREWQLGYDKLPPLPWWLVEAAHLTLGHESAYYLLAQAAVVFALAIVYRTARPLTGPAYALVAVLIVDGLHYLNYTAAKFNHDVIQLPFWALAGYAYHRALRGGWIGHWLLLGLAVGLALWAKYFFVVLAAPLMLFALIDRDARKVLATPGPYIAIAAALVTMAPHLVWLVNNDFLPFGYAEHRAQLARGWYDHLWHPLQFAISQLFFLLPALLIAAPLFFPRRATAEAPPANQSDAFDLRIVTVLALGPIATVLAMSALSGRGTIAMWGYPLWLYLGLWLVMIAKRALDAKRFARVLATWAIVFVCLATAFALNYEVLPRFDHRYRAAHYPGQTLATEVSQRFRAATGQPLAYVIGEMWTGGNVAHYSPTQPRVLIDGKPERAPWIDLADLRKRGAAIVWPDGDPAVIPPQLAAQAPGAIVQPPITAPTRNGYHSRTIGFAILPPSERR